MSYAIEKCTDCQNSADLLTLGGDFLCHGCNLKRWLACDVKKAADAGEYAIRAAEQGYVDMARACAIEAARFANSYFETSHLATAGANFAPKERA